MSPAGCLSFIVGQDMSEYAEAGWRSLNALRPRVSEWSGTLGFPIHRVDFVATFESWDHGIGVYLFFADDATLARARQSQYSEMAKTKVREILEEEGYPLARFPHISLEIDSHENVVRSFVGSYFYRLR